MDKQAFVKFLVNRNPFTLHIIYLHNIATAVVTVNHVNADSAKEVGKEIVSLMEEKQVFEYTFKRKEGTSCFNGC